MKLKLSSCLSIFDVLDCLVVESQRQNEKRIDPKLYYAVIKNKSILGKEFKKEKEFMEVYEEYSKYCKEQCDIEVNNPLPEQNETNDKQRLSILDIIKTQQKELEKENKDLIEKYTELIQKEITLKEKLYKIKLDYLPKIPKELVDFLLDYDLIIE